MAKNKHLTDEERLKIEHLLGEQTSLKQIAAKLDKHISTISREIRARAVASDKGAAHRVRNRCIQRTDCHKIQLCENKPNCTRRCSTCSKCNEVCPDFAEEVCIKLYETPYVCNGCMDEYQCTLRKRYYINRKAHEAYREMLVESRVGANITEDELLALDEFVSPLILRGQSVHHIVTQNADQLNVGKNSIYRYVSGGLLNAKNIDMPRVCRMKPRKTKPVIHKVDSKCRVGRTYAEYEAYIKENPVSVVEMDSVIGRVGGKVLLTLMFTSCDFMFAFIRERNTSQSVIDIFERLHALVGVKSFKALFPLLLTDNGSEFSNPLRLEFDAEGNKRTTVFYCDPNASFQKPHVEVNHEFIRRVLPKGKSFDSLEQSDIDLMTSHINSYPREKLGDKSPLDVFAFIYGQDILDKLGISRIPANEILLKPSLLKN
jgi:IS30 family transposase